MAKDVGTEEKTDMTSHTILRIEQHISQQERERIARRTAEGVKNGEC